MSRCFKNALLATLLLSFVVANSHADVPRESVVNRVADLYDITPQEAMQRLDAEERASEVFREVKARRIPEYAGAWFDADTMSLRVALASDPSADGFSIVERLGGAPISVEHSIADLQEVKDRILNQLGRDIGGVSIDPRMNKVEMSVRAGEKGRVDAALRVLSINPNKVFVHENYREIQLSSGYVVWANPYSRRNRA